MQKITPRSAMRAWALATFEQTLGRLVPMALVKDGMPSALGEEVRKRRVRMAERWLERHAGERFQPTELGVVLQRRRGLRISDPLLTRRTAHLSKIEHAVVDKARTPKGLAQHHRLLGRWVKPEAVGTLELHGFILSLNAWGEEGVPATNRTLHHRRERRAFTVQRLTSALAHRPRVANRTPLITEGCLVEHELNANSPLTVRSQCSRLST